MVVVNVQTTLATLHSFPSLLAYEKRMGVELDSGGAPTRTGTVGG